MGVITRQEMQIRLGDKFPDYELPDERTLRRWAHEKYCDLPERRNQYLNPQEMDWEPRRHPVYNFQEIRGPFPQPIWPTQVNYNRQTWALMDCMIFFVMLGIFAEMVQMVRSSL